MNYTLQYDIQVSDKLFKKCIKTYERCITTQGDIFGWFENDLIRRMNNEQPTMYGYNDIFKNFIKRHYYSHINNGIINDKLYDIVTRREHYTPENYEYKLKQKCKLLWSLLNVYEKLHFYEHIELHNNFLIVTNNIQ